MALSEYTGRSPEGDDETVIGRVSRHARWDIDEPTRDTCTNCEAELSLGDRHLLVTLRARLGSRVDERRYLCNESCLREWVDES